MSHKKTIVAQGPITQLWKLVRDAGVHLTSQEESIQAPIQANKTSRSESKGFTKKLSDEEVFSKAMSKVERIYWNQHTRGFLKPHSISEEDPEIEAHRLMQAAMKKTVPIPLAEHPEYIEGWIDRSGKRFLPNLRDGFYSIQGQIDLHGMNRAEAQTAVVDYIIRMSRFRSCCIKIIHGRGINTPNDRATLKDDLQKLLVTRKVSRHVVAYASSAPCDGGVGSIYVLLCPSLR